MFADGRDRPAGLTAAQGVAAEAGASWSARSGARTNELAAGEQWPTRCALWVRLGLEVVSQPVAEDKGAASDLDGWQPSLGSGPRE